MSEEILGGVRYSAAVTVPFARNELTSDPGGKISGGAGLADSYFLPLILGWNNERVALRALKLPGTPPGGSAAGASGDNVGSGYWTLSVLVGQTLAPDERQAADRVPPTRCTEFIPRSKGPTRSQVTLSISITR